MLENILNFDSLYLYDEIPDWYKDNEYIRDKYRSWEKSYHYYIKSIFKLHNETVNIWTHLIGFFFYILLIFIYNLVYFDYFENIYNKKNSIITNIYLGTASLCFLCSTIMHTMYPKSCKVCSNSCTIDYIGITLLISGSYSPFIYYLFYCNPKLEYIYIIIINTLGILNIFICFLSFMYKPKYFRYKALIYIIYILFIMVPITNKFIKDNFHFHKVILYDIKYYLLSLISYLIAIIFYLTRFPECKFNLNYIYSHSIFHIFTLIGSICILLSIFEIQFLYVDLNCINETIAIKY
jgi:adiponectin receptor